MKPKLNMEKRYVEADNWQIYKQIEPERRRDGKIVLTNPYFQTSGPAGGGGGAETLLPPYRDRTDRRHDQPAEHHAAGQCGPGEDQNPSNPVIFAQGIILGIRIIKKKLWIMIW